jgi:hypothetical protein
MLDQPVDQSSSHYSAEPRFHPPGDVAINHSPTVGTQATKTAAAGVNGQKYVVTAFAFNVAGAALAAATIGCYVIDGAAGGTTYLWQEVMAVTSTGGRISMSGLNLVGTANTALTIEFSAGVSGAKETVNISYHTLGGAGV